MARYTESNPTEILEIADKWRFDCLLGGNSLLWGDEEIWTAGNLQDFRVHFTDRPDVSQRSFEDKFREQLAAAGPQVTKLACDTLLVYFLFPSNVSSARKKEVIRRVASWKDVDISADGEALLSRFGDGIGSTGLAYNLRRPVELSYLIDISQRLVAKPQDERETALLDHMRLRELLDEAEADADATLQSRDVLLYLLFPDEYERIASRPHKNLIAKVFGEVLTGPPPEDLDDQLLAIRRKLEELLPGRQLDFYWPPLQQCWFVAGEADSLDPLQGLSIRRQIVLYGPPGTGKTYEAQALGDRLIRQGALKVMGPRRYFEESDTVEGLVEARLRRVQFHPGYSYEDFIRGLRLTEGRGTEYGDGVLLRIIDEVKDAPPEFRGVPFVLILDEMNRADLSKVLGECFSLLEDRDAVVQLAGQDETPRKVSIPPQLHLIGTMNLIDQSLEQIDFALRRRFLWYFRGFDREEFIQVSKSRWEKLLEERRLTKGWDRVVAEFELLGDRARLINEAVDKHPSLGPQYQIGHTYFCDVVYFAERDVAGATGRRAVLFSQRGRGRSETVGALWSYSLEPLLTQYLSGVDPSEAQSFIGDTKRILMGGDVR